MRVLHIDSSIRKERSVSRMLSQLLVDQVSNALEVTIDRLDLADNPPAHITQDFQNALRIRKADRTNDQVALLEESKNLVDRVKNCDLMVIGVSMYNFSIPSTLKTFIDNIVISGQTFVSDENGDKGLVSGVKAIVINSRGGKYTEDEGTAHFDFVVPYLQSVLGYIGITDLTCIKAEPTQYYGPEAKEQAVAQATEEVIREVVDLKHKNTAL
ncbi:MAG: NAD(P)H-dependent oxidoreductase [Cyclobacteriaceae bacterium]|nr:NAD(P)H-dependent oxidoreductase [Cyclobacteriaceae bacterium HetDA_MAG_MS6]